MKQRIAAESIFLTQDQVPTLQGRLSRALTNLLLEKNFPAGTKLPSSRALAKHLGISRMTVTLVYEELVALGYIKALPRSGFEVAENAIQHRPEPGTIKADTAPINWDNWLQDIPDRRRIIRKPENWQDLEFPFIYGQVDPNLFDHNAWRSCARMALGRRDISQLTSDHYGRDDPLLLDFICSTTLPRRGISAKPEEVLITMGAQNALYMAVRLLANPDRLIVTEDPGYPDFAEIIRLSHSPGAFVQIDKTGLDPASLPDNTRIVMVTPSHNIPTGATMPLARRHDLLRRAAKDDFLIIEDDYEFEMSYLSPPEPALKSLDRDGRVLYVGSFSKSLFPGLRMGYLVAPAPFIAAARALRSNILRHPPGYLQRVTAYFMGYGYYDAHIARLRKAFRERREAMIEAISKTDLRIAGAAKHGGSSMWVSSHPDLDSRKLAQNLLRKSVLIEPGHVFFESPARITSEFRLGYSSISSDKIPQGIAHIDATAKALSQTLKSTSKPRRSR